MEFLEYYRIVRGRIWIVIATALVAAIVVGVYLVIPPSSYTARGRILVHTEASTMTVRVGNNVQTTQDQGFWYTLFQVLETDTVRFRAAQEAGITDPRVVDKLEPIEGRQLSRSSVAQISAEAPGSEMAVKLTEAGMEVLRQAWDEFRLAHIKQISTELNGVLAGVQDELKPLELRMDSYKSAEEAGTPSDRLMALEARINSLEGQVQGGEIELKLAEDRVVSLRELGRISGTGSMASAYAGPVTEELRTMRKQLEELQDTLTAMLASRTEEHPAVIALQDQIADLQADIEAVRTGQVELPGPPSPIEAQVVDAQLAVADARHRIEVLTSLSIELKAQLPVYRTRAEEFDEFAREYDKLKTQERTVLAQFDQLDAEKRRLEQTEDIEILDEAVLLPSGRTPVKSVFLTVAGILGGAIVGILAVLLLHYVDATFKNAYEARRLSGRRVLGAIPRTDIVMAPLSLADAPEFTEDAMDASESTEDDADAPEPTDGEVADGNGEEGS